MKRNTMDRWDRLRHECPKLYKYGIVFECGYGWFDIIHDLSIKIEYLLEEATEMHCAVEGEENENAEMFAVQVKEKYGTLRFYMSCETREMSDLIHAAEVLSSKTCENCGATGTVRGTTWFSTRCNKCHEEKK